MQRKTKLISILLNNYNYARFLREAIDSVYAQTYPDWELILVDDGSSDGSAEIMQEYADRDPERIRAVIKENGGQASCFNAGFEAARGDVIAFLDSDDTWYPDKLEKIARAHEQHGFVTHRKHFSDGTKQIIHTDFDDRRSEFLRRFGVTDTYDITTTTLSLRRDLAEKILPMPEEGFRVCADHYVKFAALYYESPCFLKEELSFYRIHGENAFATKTVAQKNAMIDTSLDFITVEYWNERLAAQGIRELVPHRSFALTNAFWKEVGEGFELREGERYILYGTGVDSLRFMRAILDRGGRIVGYCDSNPEKWGTKHLTKTVLGPEQLTERRGDFDKVVIASMFYYPEIAAKLEEFGLQRGRDVQYTPIF